MFLSIFGKFDEFGCWDLDQIQTDADMQFTFKEFQEGLFVRGFWHTLVAPDNQEMNGQDEVTC